MASERKNETLNIVKKYINGNYYAFGENADVFDLFEIDTTKDNEIIKNKIIHLKSLFHPDLLKTIPLKYQYVYKYITENLVTSLDAKPTIPYSVYIANKKDAIKKQLRLVEGKYITQEQKHKFYNDSYEKLNKKIKEYIEEENHKKYLTELKPDLEELHKLIAHYISLPKDKIRNIYAVFEISDLQTQEEILKNPKYLNIKKLLSLDFNYYKELFGNTVEQNTALKDLKYLYDKCNEEYFLTQESKNRYDLELKEMTEKKINIDEIMSILQNYSTKYYNNNKNIVDIFETFNIDKNKSNDLIKASKEYSSLIKVFDPEIKKYIPDYYKHIYEELNDYYNKLIELLNDEFKRNIYEKSLIEKKEQIKKETFNIYEIINDYQKNYEELSFINYYDLFKLDINSTIEEIKKSNNYLVLKKALNKNNISRISNPKDALSFNDLSNIFDNFTNVILSSEEKKSSYDKKILTRTFTIPDFKYIELHNKENTKYEKIREDYYKTFEYILIKNGVTKTINILETCIDKDDFNDDPDASNLLSDYTPKQLLKMLKSDFGNKLNEKELLESSFNQYITKKIDILKIGVIRTYDKYGIEQVKKALSVYVSTGEPDFFTSGDATTIGRGKIAKEVPPILVKIILGCLKQKELGFLIDDIDNNYDLIENKGSIDLLIDVLIKDHINR